MSVPAITPELGYIALLFALFVVPRILQRYRIPTALTSFALGAGLALSFGLFTHDPTIELLSTFGIVSLFLFAGLDVDLHELRREARSLVVHVVFRLAMLALVGWAAMRILGLDARAAALVSLALLTPSTGFILDSLRALRLNEREQFWVRSKAIATEFVALGVLFATVQSTTVVRFSVSVVALGLLIALLPMVFNWFAKRVVPWAPKSEFAFLIMVAVVCAIVTRELGVYYLVGAFVVGMAALRFREQLPAMASEQMLHAVEAFASLFVPFYFFHAGLLLDARNFSPAALLTGLVFVAVGIPLRLSLVALHRRLTAGSGLKESLRISVPLLPTLVFTLVVVQILRDRFEVPPYLLGGLIVYTIVNTLVPSLVLKSTPEFTMPHALEHHPLGVPREAGGPAEWSAGGWVPSAAGRGGRDEPNAPGAPPADRV